MVRLQIKYEIQTPSRCGYLREDSKHITPSMFGNRNVPSLILLCLCGMGLLFLTSASAPDPKLQANVGKKQPIIPAATITLPHVPLPEPDLAAQEPMDQDELQVEDDFAPGGNVASPLTTPPPADAKL
jgi:hypothetical protein